MFETKGCPKCGDTMLIHEIKPVGNGVITTWKCKSKSCGIKVNVTEKDLLVAVR